MNDHEYTLKDITKITNGYLIGENRTVSIILTDSRVITSPEDCLFFAIKGKNHDGINYIKDILQVGVRSFVVNKDNRNEIFNDTCSYIFVDNVLESLQKLSSYHLNQKTIKKIAITGSNGKTIVKEWLSQLLGNRYNVCKSPLSYNSQVGVPLSLLLADKNTEIGIFEVGMSEPGEIQKLEELIKPQYGIFTNIGDAHQENFESLEIKCDEKLLLFKDIEKIIYCKDHKLIDSKIQEKYISSFSWGIHPKSDVKIISSQLLEHEETRLELQISNNKHIVIIPFSDEVSIENAMHALTMYYFITKEIPQLNNLQPVAMRQEIKLGNKGNLIIDDSYNSDIHSIHLSLNLLDLKKEAQQKKVCILSDLFQFGKKPKTLYKKVAELMNLHKIDLFVGIGSQLALYKNLFPSESSLFFNDTDNLCNSKLLDEFEHSAILIKGARQFKLERVVKKLEQKVYQTTLEVDLKSISNNINYFRSKLNPNTLIMGMVKADAYGCGAIEVAKLLQYEGCNYLAVALADEGAELRKAGIIIPIVVMNPEPYAFDIILEHKLELEIYSMELLIKFHKFLNKHGVINYPIHIKLDTGMHRLGFVLDDMQTLLGWLKCNHSIYVKSIFSHLAGSDEESLDSFTHEQVKLFKEMSCQLKQVYDKPILHHILNSAGVIRFPEYQMDLVRLGIGLYCKTSSKDILVETVSSLKTHILQIKKVSTKEYIGYGCKGKLDKNSNIAILPIGYADGLNRLYGNGNGFVLWNETPLYFVGNICMDMSMIDIGDYPIKEGDEVVIFGDKNPPYKVAQSIGTIAYEIITNVSHRVKRIYYI